MRGGGSPESLSELSEGRYLGAFVLVGGVLAVVGFGPDGDVDGVLGEAVASGFDVFVTGAVVAASPMPARNWFGSIV